MTISLDATRRPLLRFIAVVILASAVVLVLLAGSHTALANGGSGRGAEDAAASDGRHDGAAAETADQEVGGQTVPELTVGTSAVINDEPVNLRADASTSAEVIAELSIGATVTIVGGPVGADGVTWFQVETDAGTGWVAGEYLTATGAAFAAGETVTVSTEGLNLRSDAGLDAGIVATLGSGTPVTVLGEPVDADGYTWYQVEANAGTGWVAGEYLAESRG